MRQLQRLLVRLYLPNRRSVGSLLITLVLGVFHRVARNHAASLVRHAGQQSLLGWAVNLVAGLVSRKVMPPNVGAASAT